LGSRRTASTPSYIELEEQGIDALIVSKRCAVPDRAENYDAMSKWVSGLHVRHNHERADGPDTFDGLLHMLDCHLVPVWLAMTDGYGRLEDDIQMEYINWH
jgi:hypothetical protein